MFVCVCVFVCFVTCFNRFEGEERLMTRGCGLRETSRVDYTERRKTEREKENVLHHRALQHREKRSFV